MTQTLGQLLPFAETYFLVVSRILFFVLCMPGLENTFVPRRVRLLFALGLGYMVAPLLFETQPQLSLLGIVREGFVGFFLGTVVRLLMSGLSMVGGVLSHQTSFGNVMGNMFSEDTRDLFSLLCNLYFVTLFFASDLHIPLMRGLLNSYDLLPVNVDLVHGDVLKAAVRYLAIGFEAAISLSAPFLILGVFYHILLGLLNRLVPTLPVIFIGQPLILFVILMTFMVCISRFAHVFLDVMSSFVKNFFV